MECLFCKIINNKEESFKIYEDDFNLVILDKYTIHLAHALIIPKKHSNDFLSTDKIELEKSITLTQKVAQAIDKEFSPDGFRFISNIRSAGNQVIFHTHFHIIPIYSQTKKIEINQKIADKIKKALKA